MPESSGVGRRYAAGAFQLASEEGSIDRWRHEIARLEELLGDEVLVAAFQNPAVDANRRMELAKLLAPELRPQTKNFLRLIVEHQRTRDMPAIRREFDRLADEAAGIIHVTMTTAIPLNESDRSGYRQALARKLGRQVALEFREDPGMLGGAMVLIGDHLVDGSVRTQLERLRQALES